MLMATNEPTINSQEPGATQQCSSGRRFSVERRVIGAKKSPRAEALALQKTSLNWIPASPPFTPTTCLLHRLSWTPK